MDTVSGRNSDLAAKSSTAWRVNGACAKQANTGCPASVVCTAAMKGTLFSEPRPLLPPERLPPRYASSIFMRPLSWRVSSQLLSPQGSGYRLRQPTSSVRRRYASIREMLSSVRHRTVRTADIADNLSATSGVEGFETGNADPHEA